MSEEILYTPEELAQKLKLSKYTIYEMIKRGDIHAHHIGRSIRVSQSQLDLYLISSKKTDNVFEAKIVIEDGLSYAVRDDVKICVNTDLDGDVKISIPPEDIILSSGTFVCSARNMLKGTVTDIKPAENSVRVVIDVGFPLSALITKRSLSEMNIKKDDTLYAIFKTMSVKVIK